jgi:hypothetical protein
VRVKKGWGEGSELASLFGTHTRYQETAALHPSAFI